MFPSKIKSFLIFLIFPCYVFNQVCTYQNSTGCNNHGKCTKSGTCLCDLYYYGVNCESSVDSKSRVTIVETGISQGDLAGIIIGWMFGLFFLIGLSVFVFWYCKNKDRRHSNSFNNDPNNSFPAQDAYPIPVNPNSENYQNIMASYPPKQQSSLIEMGKNKNNDGNVNENIEKNEDYKSISNRPIQPPNEFFSGSGYTNNGQAFNNDITIAIEKNEYGKTPYADELKAKFNHLSPYLIQKIISPEFLSLISKNAQILGDVNLMNAFESKLFENKPTHTIVKPPAQIMPKQINSDDEIFDLLNSIC